MRTITSGVCGGMKPLRADYLRFIFARCARTIWFRLHCLSPASPSSRPNLVNDPGYAMPNDTSDKSRLFGGDVHSPRCGSRYDPPLFRKHCTFQLSELALVR